MHTHLTEKDVENRSEQLAKMNEAKWNGAYEMKPVPAPGTQLQPRTSLGKEFIGIPGVWETAVPKQFGRNTRKPGDGFSS